MSKITRAIRALTQTMRAAEREERKAKGPVRLTSRPKCRVCSTSVPAGVDFCDAPTCQARARMTAPKGTIEMGKQPVPPRGRNFANPVDE